MKKILLCLILMACGLHAYCQINTNRIMSIGRNALYFEDYVLSIQYFNRVINVKPYLADPYYYRGIAKFYLDDLNGAANDCEVAIGINPFLIGAYNLKGIINLRQGKSDLALKDFTAGLDLEPDNMNLLLNSGIANINLKEYESAIAAYDKLLEYDKNNVPAILYRGIALVEKGDTISAMAEFIRASDINKYSADAFTYRGMLHYQMKDYAEALKDFNKLHELRPQDANVYVNRAITKYNLDDYNGAFEDLDEALRLDSKNKMAYANRGMLRAEVGDYNKAAEDFTRVLSIDASDDIALFNRAMIYIQTGEIQNALGDLNIIIAKHPDFGPAYYQRAIVKRYLNDQKGSELDYMTAYTFEQERIKRGLENGDKANNGKENDEEKGGKKEKKDSRSKNDNDIKKYNQMVVVSDFGDNDNKLSQDADQIRGRVQDRDIAVDLEPVFELSFFSSDTILPKAHYYEKSVEQFNNNKVYSRPLVITNREYTGEGNESLFYFNQIREIGQKIDLHPTNYDLYMVRGTLYNTVMNYNNAINDFNVCILKNSFDVNAYFNRAATRYKMVEVIRSMDSETYNMGEIQLGTPANNMRSELSVLDFDLIMSDLRQVLQLAPDFEFAYYNMSLVQCARKQYTEAMESLNKAIELNKDFAEAYFNRGIINIYLGNEKEGADDLSKAGELGIHKAYNVIKRYTGKDGE
ncbi:MAG: tetratricopeptide repeat protein [Bacteroidales bacterium]|nr:tetratricopeptide repeat protein [Bacteroidales bacterium]